MTLEIDWNSVLFSAIQNGDLAKSREAVSAGSNVDHSNDYGVTPLLEATGQGSFELVQLLISAGAKIDYNEMGEGSPVMLVAYLGQVDVLQLFVNSAANVNIALPLGRETPLHMAAVARQTAAAKILLGAGGNPNLHTNSNVSTSMFDGNVKLWSETPLHFAAAYGDEEMIQAVLREGANQNAVNTHNETPIDYAHRHRRPRSIISLFA